VTEIDDGSHEPRGLPSNSRGRFDHTIRLTAYPKRQRRNRMYVPDYEELKRQCTYLFNQGLVRVSNSPYAAPTVIVRKPDGSIRVCGDSRALNKCNVK
jgi:hypothetical protein